MRIPNLSFEGQFYIYTIHIYLQLYMYALENALKHTNRHTRLPKLLIVAVLVTSDWSA